jgi:hypothetical protein
MPQAMTLDRRHEARLQVGDPGFQLKPNPIMIAPAVVKKDVAGVGLFFKMDNMGRYYVEMVMPKSSAEATGVVERGDILEVVDEKTTIGVSLAQLRDMILGKTGSYVNLSFLREKGGDSFRYDVDLFRGTPNMPMDADEEVNTTVKGYQRSQRSAGHPSNIVEDYPVSSPQSLASNPEHFKLVEQRMLAAERELQISREQMSSLQDVIGQLMNKDTVQDLESAVQRCKLLELELDQERQQPKVPYAQYQALEAKMMDLEEELRRQIAIVNSHQAGPANDQIQRMCVMALPAAVSALHNLSEESGHASSATWALVRAEDYVAHLASSRYPLSIPGLVSCIEKGASLTGTSAVTTQEIARILTDTQDASLAMSVISWDPEVLLHRWHLMT